MKRFNTPKSFMPEGEIGYGLSQDAQFAMKDLSITMDLMSLAFDGTPNTAPIDIEGYQVAAMLRGFERQITAIIADSPCARLDVMKDLTEKERAAQ